MSDRAWLLLRLAVLAAIGLAWADALHAPWVYDDKVEVIGNLTIRLIDKWREIASYNLSRPIVVFSYAWNYHLWELDPFGYHVVNVVIHGLATLAAFTLAETLARLGGHPRPRLLSGLAVAIWALHPMTTQAVTYVTGRSESLCALFCLAGLAAWAQALERERAEPLGGWGEAGGRALGLVALLLALLSKEVGLAWPLAALSLEIGAGNPAGGPMRERLAAVRWRWYAPMAALIGLAVVAKLLSTPAFDAAWDGEDPNLSLWTTLGGGLRGLVPHEVDRPLAVQLTTSAEVWLRYAGLWIAPVGQTLFHAQPDLQPLSLRGAAAILGLVAAISLSIAWSRKAPMAGQLLVFAALFLLPSSSFAPLKETMAEHRSYGSGLYLILALAFSLTGPWRVGGTWRMLPARLTRYVAAGAGALIVLGLALTRERNAVWGSEIALWTEATQRSPGDAMAWYGLGDAQRFAGEFEEALAAYDQVLKLDPDNLDAWNNKGIALAELGDAKGAYDAWRGALRVSPTYCKAHNNIGFLALRRREWDLALIELNSALTWCPENVLAHWGLGNIYYGPRRDPQKAAAHYQAVLELDPSFDRKSEVEARLLELTW